MMERTLGREFYFSEEIFAGEKDRIFCREWFCAGREEELPAGGDYLVVEVAGENVQRGMQSRGLPARLLRANGERESGHASVHKRKVSHG